MYKSFTHLLLPTRPFLIVTSYETNELRSYANEEVVNEVGLTLPDNVVRIQSVERKGLAWLVAIPSPNIIHTLEDKHFLIFVVQPITLLGVDHIDGNNLNFTAHKSRFHSPETIGIIC